MFLRSARGDTMLVGDRRMGVNRIGLIIVIPIQPLWNSPEGRGTRSVGRSVCNSIPVLTVYGWTLYTSTVVCIILSIMTV
jgi:hypothetical protein